ncbi:MAG: bifunctional 5,10-methylenetetrahydrofolate dehydrogenase/5,10-methenyltetrahydrofolate cyclohydrolase [Acidobacteriota bacterium]
MSSQDSSPQILKGKPVAAALQAEVSAGVDALLAASGRRPKLVAVLVGANPASAFYVASKTKACREVGIEGVTLELPESIEYDDLMQHLRDLENDPTVDGILVQLPLPNHLPERAILESVPPDKDVDGFHPYNVGRMWLDKPAGRNRAAASSVCTPATPTGIIELLRRSGIELSGRHAVIVGRSAIVGKPMAALLLRHNCTVTLCHSRTQDLPAVCRQADILVAAIGRPAMIGPEHVKEGAVVIDVGINRVSERDEVERLFPGNAKRLKGFDRRGYSVVGDVDYHRVAPRSAAITPVPGGVGPLTVAQLLVNTLFASQQRQSIETAQP